MRKIYTAFVTLFWLTMMGLLFQKEVLPNFIITGPTGYKIALTNDIPVRQSWMGIYYKDKKIGFSNTVMSQDVDNGVAGYRTQETTVLRLNVMGENRFISIKGGSFFSENYRLRNFNYKLVSDDHRLLVKGDVKDGNLNLVVDIGGDRIEKTLKRKENILISNSVSPMLLFKKLDRDREVNFEIFDPVTFGTQKVTIKNIGKEAMEFNGISIDADIFEIDISGIKTRTWVTEDGDILKEDSALGFTMYKETPEQALEIACPSLFNTEDLISDFALSLDKEILNPRDVSYLKIHKNGMVVEILKEIEPITKDILSIPIEDIREEDFIQSRDEKIIQLAKQIIGDTKDSWVASKAILHWVYDNIRKTPTLSVPSSLDVLRTMQGDCNEHTVLFTALTRSLGIPTKMIAGLVYLNNSFYYHAWPKVYVGKWVEMDPTLGQEIADATHIPLLEGGLKEQLELIRIIPELEIEVIEYR